MFYHEESIVDTEGNFLLQKPNKQCCWSEYDFFLGQTNATTCTNLTINSHQNKLEANGETKALVTSLWRTRLGMRKLPPLTFLALPNLTPLMIVQEGWWFDKVWPHRLRRIVFQQDLVTFCSLCRDKFYWPV